MLFWPGDPDWGEDGEGEDEVGRLRIILGALRRESGIWLGVDEPAVDAKTTFGCGSLALLIKRRTGDMDGQ